MLLRNASEMGLSRVGEIYDASVTIKRSAAGTEDTGVESRGKWFRKYIS